MLDGWTEIIEATALARTLRASVWAYPLVNAGHLLGIALLVGAIVPLDLRLLGLWSSLPLPPLWRLLSRCAAAGLALAAVCGVLLFVCRATVYGGSGLFIAKMVAVAVGTVNAIGLQIAVSGDHRQTWRTSSRLPVFVRAAACVSLAAWLAALVLGRLVGYF